MKGRRVKKGRDDWMESEDDRREKIQRRIEVRVGRKERARKQ